MTSRSAFRTIAATAAVLLAWAGTAAAQTGGTTAPPGAGKPFPGTIGPAGSSGAWKSTGGTGTGGTTVGGTGSTGTTTGGSGTTGGTGGMGGTGSTSGGLGGFTGGGLLPPELEFLVLLDTLMTADNLMNTLGIQFDTELELLVFVLMIYEQKYAAAVQAFLGGTGGTGGTTTTTGMP